MVLYQHIRNNEPIAYRWGWWHAAVLDTVLEGETTKIVDHDFAYEDTSDGEVMEFKVGDVITKSYSR